MITTAHIMVTSLCDRDCKYCCNKQYDLNDIPYITDEELRQMKHIYITGGEPFIYSNPNNIAQKLKCEYPNIERIIVYSNAWELASYLRFDGDLLCIDGLTVSIKDYDDKVAFEKIILKNRAVNKLEYNRLYVFPGFEDVVCPDSFQKVLRVWQEKFAPAPNCIFRRL